jgi:hypothetical protein
MATCWKVLKTVLDEKRTVHINIKVTKLCGALQRYFASSCYAWKEQWHAKTGAFCCC